MGVSHSPSGGHGVSSCFNNPIKRGRIVPSRLRSAKLALTAAAAAGVMGAFTATRVHATVGTWNVVGSGNWNTGANWTSNPNFPSAAGDTANLTNTGGGTLTLTANESVGFLNVGGPSVASYVVAGNNTFTFDSGNSSGGVAAQLNVLTGNTTTFTISAPLALNSNLNVNNLDMTNKPVSFTSASITGGGFAINYRGEGSYYSGSMQLTMSGGSISNISAIRNLYGSADPLTTSGADIIVSDTITNTSNLELDSYADGALQVSGAISVSTGGLTVNGPGSLSNMSPIAANATYSDTGEVFLSGTNTISGATSVNAAFLYLEYSTNNNNKIDSASALNLNSGYLLLDSNSSAASTQAVSGLVIGGGASEMKLISNSSKVMTFNAGSGGITRSGNSTIDFSNSNATTAIVLTSGNTNTAGILPAWMTWGSTDWATVNAAGQIVQYTGYTAITAGGTLSQTDTNNSQLSNGSLTVNGWTTNSLKVIANGNYALTLNSNLTLTSGGLITNFTNNGLNVNVSGGGSIVAGTGAGELVLQTNGSAGALVVNTSVTAGSVTKSGAGEVLFTSATLPGQITVNQGTLALAGSASLSTGSNLALNSGGAFGMTGTFNGSIGTAAGQVQFGQGGGGFSAVGGPLSVNFNGAGAVLNSSQLNGTLVLNNVAATAPITLVNPININTAGLTLSVGNSGGLNTPTAYTQNFGNNGYAYTIVGAITGIGDLHIQGSPTSSNDAPSGLLVPTGPLTYAGRTIVTGSALYASPNAASLPATTSLELSGGGVIATSGTFNWAVGGGAGQVTLGSYGGFAAMGGPLTVELNNNTNEPLTGRYIEALTLGSVYAGNSVNYENTANATTLDLVSAGPVLNQFSGLITGTGALADVGGGGELLLPGTNTFTGGFSVGKGDGFVRLGSGNVTVGTTVYSPLGLEGAALATGTSGFNVSSPGAGYTNVTGATLTLPANNPGGTSAVATYNIVGGAVTYFSITTAGNGFYQAPSITIPGTSTTPAVVSATNVAGTSWSTANSLYGTLDLNGTTTSEPFFLGNGDYGSMANIINSNTSNASVVNSDITLYNAQGPVFGGAGNIVFNGNVYGNVADAFFKQGGGILTLTGQNNQGGVGGGAVANLNFALYGGTVILDYNTANNNNNKLAITGTGALALSDVNLQINGNAIAATVQSVSGTGGTKLPIAGNTILVTTNGGQNATLNLGPITRTTSAAGSAGTIDFQTNTTSGGVASITAIGSNNATGILTPTVSAGGSYTAAPAVTFSVSPSGAAGTATGYAVWNSTTDAVTAVILTSPGFGYTAAPTISFASTYLSGAAATATESIGTYGYLGGWATFGGGSSFASVNNVSGAISSVPSTSYGTMVAPGKLLDVGTGNGAGVTSGFNDSSGATYSSSGITNGVVGAIRFNDANTTVGSPDTLTIAAGQTLVVGGAVSSDTVGAGGILDTANTGSINPSIITGGTIQFGTNESFYIAQYNTLQPLRIDSQINLASSGASIVKTGPGELQLDSASNAAGIGVFGGTVTVNSVGAMGGNGITLGGGTTFKIATINGTAFSSGTYAKAVTLNGAATFDNEGGSGNTLTFGTTTYDFTSALPWDLTIAGTGDIYLDGGIAIGANYSSANTSVFKSIITPGFGQLIKNGTNNLTISGTSLISGGVVINNGTVTLANATDTLPNNEPIAINSVTNGPSGTLSISSPDSDVVGPITLNGGSITGNGTLQAMAYNFNAGNVSASLTGIVGIYKAGVGTVTLTASSSNYSGTTVVTQGTLLAGAMNTLSPNAAINVSGGTLDVSGFNNSIPSLVVGSAGTVNLGFNAVLTDTGTATLAGTLNISSGTVSGSPDILMTYASETGNFSTGVFGVPVGYKLIYAPTALEVVAAGPATLTWNNAGGTGDGITWDTVNQNWNNGTSVTTYNNTSNTSSGDIVIFNDTNNGHYNVSISGVVSPTSTTFNNSNGNYTVAGINSSSGIAGPGSVTKFGISSVTLSGSNTYTGGTNVSAGTLTFASANAFPVNTSLTIASGATVTIANHSTNATFVPVASLLSNSGTLDLTNNAMIIHNGSIGTITAQITAAYNNGAWNGTNASIGVITSSVAMTDSTHLTAIGVATGLTTFEGATVAATDVLVKYTYYGDANLDGHVDGSDYSRIDNGALTGLTGWSNGDFNYDGVINGSDYTLIDNAYNMQSASLAAEIGGAAAVATAQIAGTSAVPEPTTLGLLGIATAGLLGRRSNRRRQH